MAAVTAAVCGIIYHQVSGFSISRIVDGVADSAKSLTKWDNSKVSHAVQATTLDGWHGAIEVFVQATAGNVAWAAVLEPFCCSCCLTAW